MKAARPRTATVGGLQGLGGLRDALQRAEREAAEAAARREAERAAAEKARREFEHAVEQAIGKVHPLPPHRRAETGRSRPEPLPLQRALDEAEALRQALSDEVDIETLLLTDDGLAWRRPSVHPDVVTRLRRGQWSIQAQIDLHGLRRDEAREALATFVRESARRGQRCLRVVHGKGNGSPGREPVLKGKAQKWLAQCAEVLAFTQASAPQGGAGALIVLLAGSTGR